MVIANLPETLWLLPLGLLILLAFNTILNVLTFPRLKPTTPYLPLFISGRKRERPGEGVLVSILVPARDEAGKIGDTVRRLLSQDYFNLEVLVLDDHSTDGTPQEAWQAAVEDPRFRLLRGQALPSGWLGKNWACHLLGEVARGEIMIFTDADVRWEPGALRAILAIMTHSHADLLTVWPRQETKTWSERLVVPLMTFTILAYLPELAVRFIPWPVFAAANGQCMVLRRQAYMKIGGHATVRGSVLDDMSLAWNIKRNGLRLVQTMDAGLVSTRMYTNWTSVRAGFAKNILAGHGGQPALLLLSAAFHWLLFLLPWVWLALGWNILWLNSGWPLAPLVMIALGLGIRLLSAAAAGQRLDDALLLPVSVVLMTIIAAQAMLWYWRGAATWKGRKIPSS
jgi:chlorobactene glucosyltransferase